VEQWLENGSRDHVKSTFLPFVLSLEKKNKGQIKDLFQISIITKTWGGNVPAKCCYLDWA
jgi:hypothetical protein